MAHHSAPPSSPSRRRLEIVAAVVFIVVAIVLIVFAINAVRHPKGQQAGQANPSVLNSSSPAPSTPAPGTPAPTTPPPSTPPPTTPPPSTPAPSTSAGVNRLPLVVLNNVGSASINTTAVSRFSAGGWTATDGGTFEGDILSSAAYYDPNADGSRAAALALQSQFPVIQRVVPRFAGLPAGPVIVILTSDYH